MTRPVLRRTSVFGAAALVALLTGCTASANVTVDPDAFATEVASTLQQQIGSEIPPNIDCGEESIDIVADETVMCELSVDGDPAIYDTTVTITEVEGTEYAFDIQVAEEPR